jgi:hypothetical protein
VSHDQRALQLSGGAAGVGRNRLTISELGIMEWLQCEKNTQKNPDVKIKKQND